MKPRSSRYACVVSERCPRGMALVEVPLVGLWWLLVGTSSASVGANVYCLCLLCMTCVQPLGLLLLSGVLLAAWVVWSSFEGSVSSQVDGWLVGKYLYKFSGILELRLSHCLMYVGHR